MVGTIGWLVYENPDIREIHPQPLVAVLTCKVSTFSLIMSLVYNMVLILLCTLYAFKTRKIPENFNEAKYIGFTMYSTCIVWLAFLPIYFGTNNEYKVKLKIFFIRFFFIQHFYFVYLKREKNRMPYNKTKQKDIDELTAFANTKWTNHISVCVCGFFTLLTSFWFFSINKKWQ